MSHFLRSKLVSHLLDKLDLKRNDDVAKETHPSRIRKGKFEIFPQTTLGYFRATSFMQKPFRCRLQWSPYQFEYWEIRINRNPNLSLKHKRKGGKYDEWFHYALPSWPSWIWKPIKKQKITTFAEDGAVVKRTTKGAIEEIKMERDLMGKLLMISLKGKLDIGIFLTLSVNSVATCIFSPWWHYKPHEQSCVIQELRKKNYQRCSTRNRRIYYWWILLPSFNV